MARARHLDHVVLIVCPGCEKEHPFDQRWEFNGDLDRPTFRPSLRVFGKKGETLCHSFVVDGRIQFLDDCAHNLKGQTVDLPEIER
jgi:hypothetical protein